MIKSDKWRKAGGLGLLVFVLSLFGCGSGGVTPETTTTTAAATTTTSTTTTTTTTTTLPRASSPVIKGPGNAVNSSFEANSILVTIEAGASGADNIYYTTNGTTPTTSSNRYTAPISLEVSRTVKAIAVKSGFSASETSSAWFDLYWWQPLGSLPNNMTNFTAIASDAEGNIYAGGLTSTDPYQNFFKWDGNSWLNATTFNSIVRAVAHNNSSNSLYCGGDFDAINSGGDEILVNRLARWTGTTWESLGGGFNNGGVAALAISGTSLYAGGDFISAEGRPANYIAKWNGLSWEALGEGLDAPAYCLAVDASGSLYVGGQFSLAGGSAAPKIAKWDGESWGPLAAGSNGNVYALAVAPGGILYAGGILASRGIISPSGTGAPGPR